MSAATPDVKLANEPNESFGSHLSGMFSFLIDPKSAATRLFTRWFWIYPLALFVIVSLISSAIVAPIVQHVLETQPMPPGANPETYTRGIQTGMAIQRVAGAVFPIISVLLQALILWGMASMMAVNTGYRQMLNLAAGCSIISALAAIAGVIILKLKGEVSTMAELRPALGLDIFLPEGANKFVTALLGYFSIFEIWWIVMMVLILAAAYRMAKGKAFTIVLPLVVISLLFRLVGAAFQRTP
jgi:hypothetical protein